jgi:hypothetical protein
MLKNKLHLTSLSAVALLALSAPAALADTVAAATSTPSYDYSACKASDDVYTDATLVPGIHVKGKCDLSFGKIAVGYKDSTVEVDNYGKRYQKSGDACPVGKDGTAACFNVTGSQGAGFKFYVNATDLKGTYYPDSKLTMVPKPYAGAGYLSGDKPTYEGNAEIYVGGTLYIPAGAKPDVYKGKMTLTAEYL